MEGFVLRVEDRYEVAEAKEGRGEPGGNFTDNDFLEAWGGSRGVINERHANKAHSWCLALFEQHPVEHDSREESDDDLPDEAVRNWQSIHSEERQELRNEDDGSKEEPEVQVKVEADEAAAELGVIACFDDRYRRLGWWG